MPSISAPTAGRNKRSVWTVSTKPFTGAHFAVMPEALVEPCVLAGSKPNDVILDPFAGSGTVGVVALKHNRNFVGIELNPTYADIARDRLANCAPLLNDVLVAR
jgi:DNA modification methylase